MPNTDHIHVGAIHGVIVAAYVILTMFVMRYIIVQWPDSLPARVLAAAVV